MQPSFPLHLSFYYFSIFLFWWIQYCLTIQSLISQSPSFFLTCAVAPTPVMHEWHRRRRDSFHRRLHWQMRLLRIAWQTSAHASQSYLSLSAWMMTSNMWEKMKRHLQSRKLGPIETTHSMNGSTTQLPAVLVSRIGSLCRSIQLIFIGIGCRPPLS